jgi:hypothetical protein
MRLGVGHSPYMEFRNLHAHYRIWRGEGGGEEEQRLDGLWLYLNYFKKESVHMYAQTSKINSWIVKNLIR